MRSLLASPATYTCPPYPSHPAFAAHLLHGSADVVQLRCLLCRQDGRPATMTTVDAMPLIRARQLRFRADSRCGLCRSAFAFDYTTAVAFNRSVYTVQPLSLSSTTAPLSSAVAFDYRRKLYRSAVAFKHCRLAIAFKCCLFKCCLQVLSLSNAVSSSAAAPRCRTTACSRSQLHAAVAPAGRRSRIHHPQPQLCRRRSKTQVVDAVATAYTGLTS